MTFRIGQRVVCINATGMNGLTKGREYAVSYVHYDGCVQVGFDPQPIDFLCAYHDGRFRPVVERKTDISFAHEILRKASKRVRA